MSRLKNTGTPELGRRERKKADKLERIEDAARELFTELGYEETTTRAIAERADIAAGTLFTYFPEKRLVLVHLMRRDVDRAIERGFKTMPSVPPAAPADALVHLFKGIYRVYERDRGLARVFVKEALFLDGELGAELGAWTITYIARLGSLLEEWRAAGVLGKHVEPATAAYQIFAQYYFGLVGWLGTSALSAQARDDMFAASIAQLVRGIGKENG
jgi:AcrR family transcriptional regulator